MQTADTAPDTAPEQKKKKLGRPANGATASMTIGIQPELKEKLALYARKRHRSTSALACLIIKHWLETHTEDPRFD